MCALLFAAQFNFLSAQTTVMKVWKGGNVTSSISTADIDSVTFGSNTQNNVTNLGDGVYLINGHKFIDLGLPSGILWAETNIGAETAADDGNYYAWGETTTKDYYDTSIYKYYYCASSSSYTKYNSTDGKTVLEFSDDAAYVNWGSLCRMPTQTEFKELRDITNCKWTWTSKITSFGESIEGYRVVSVKNGNSIFLPASGCRYFYNIYGHGYSGIYYSSTLYSNDTNFAYCLNLGSDSWDIGIGERYSGHTIRPVAEP